MRQNFYWNANLNYVQSLLENVIKDEELMIGVMDVTSLNDTSPSLAIDTETQSYILFLPNSWRNQDEETSTYMLMYSDDLGFCEKEYKLYNTIGEFINDLVRNSHKDLLK
jgi:hypothetical protein